MLADPEVTADGIFFTAIGAVCFVSGVALARLKTPVDTSGFPTGGARSLAKDRRSFALFCLLGGWVFTYGLSPLHQIPSLGAAVDKGGAIWMLGVMLGLRDAVQQRNLIWTGTWLGALLVYPILMLLLGGFLSYGSAALIVVGSVLTISTRSYGRVAAGLAIATYLGLSLFVNYFESRSAIRDEVWGGAPLDQRIDTVLGAASNFHWLDWTEPLDLHALDERLNQNFFVGLAAERIETGQVNYLYGRSLWESAEALVPRVIWPDKPVFAGSPEIVAAMTGLELSPTSSFGVGNVMEFQINFGLEGVIGGFLLLGWLIGMLDRKAAAAERKGELGRTISFFLPAVALIQPGGSMIEMASDAAAALAAAYGWKWVWGQWPKSARLNDESTRRPVPPISVKVFLAGTSFRPEYGGPAYSVSRLAIALAEAGVEVGLWAPDQSAKVTPLLPANARSVRRMRGSAADALHSFGRPDILHDNGIWLPHHHRLANLAKKQGIPRVVSTRGMLAPWAIHHKRWKKTIAWSGYQRRDLANANCHHATAEPEARTIRRLRLGVPVSVIPNRVDLPESNPISSRHLVPRNEWKTALFLGRIYPVKGLPMLVEAWAQVCPENWKLRIAGPDEAGHRFQLERAISEAGLDKVVSFLGPLEGWAKQAAFADADLFVLPSHSESFGMVIGEALAHKLPVLTTTATPWSMLRDYDCGWCVEPSVAGLTEGLGRATSCDFTILRAMGERGQAFVAREFGWARIARRFVEIYQGIITGHSKIPVGL